MIRGIALSPVSIPSSSAALDGGKAPAGWGRDMEEKIAGLEALRRGGGWIEELVGVHPNLFEGPLLGRTLEALTGLAEPQQEVQPRAIRPRKTRYSRRENPSEPDWNRTAVGDQAVPPSPVAVQARSLVTKGSAPRKEAPTGNAAQALLQLKRQADHSLLSRLSGHNVAFESTERRQSLSLGPKEKSSATPFPSAYEDSAVRLDWLNRAAQRAARALRWAQADAAGMATRIQSETQPHDDALMLGKQGKMPLDETEASSELLSGLAQEDRPGREENKETAQRAEGAPRRAQLDAAGTVKPTRSEMHAHEEVGSLAEQWRVPVDGPCASSELLDWLAQEDFSGNEDNTGAMPRPVTRSQSPFSSEQARRPDSVERADASFRRDSHGQLSSASEQGRSPHSVERADRSPHRGSLGQQSSSPEKPDFFQPSWLPDGPSEPSGGRVGWHGEPVNSSNDLETGATPPVTARADSSFFAPESGTGGHAGYDESEMESSVPGIPPTVAPPLPPLLSPQRSGLQPRPEAAATARQAVRGEAPPATDDLDVLAAKIKRILDEQARRHGIDV